MSFPPLDLDHLSRVCASATAGPWHVRDAPFSFIYVCRPNYTMKHGSRDDVCLVSLNDHETKDAPGGGTIHRDVPRKNAANDATFIATFNPQLIEALLAGYRARGEALEALVNEVCDYAIINNLGDPEKKHNIRLARAALSLPLKTETR